MLYKPTSQLLQHLRRLRLTFLKNKRSTSHVWHFKATDTETQMASQEFLQARKALKMTCRPRVTMCFPRFPTARTLPSKTIHLDRPAAATVTCSRVRAAVRAAASLRELPLLGAAVLPLRRPAVPGRVPLGVTARRAPPLLVPLAGSPGLSPVAVLPFLVTFPLIAGSIGAGSWRFTRHARSVAAAGGRGLLCEAAHSLGTHAAWLPQGSVWLQDTGGSRAVGPAGISLWFQGSRPSS